VKAWKLTVGVVAAATGLAIALILRDRMNGLSLVLYAFALGGGLVILLFSRLVDAMPRADIVRSVLPRATHPSDEVEQFRMIARQLTLSSSSELDLHYHLRPIVREIASARLTRRHGIDLDREPERAKKLIGGGRVWELVRPDREPPEDRAARGWSKADLERLMHELEEL
jgi:hypothetical protein